MKFGLIGAGSMGRAIVSGAVKAGVLSGSDIQVSARTRASAEQFADSIGAEAVTNATAGQAQIVMLAVKPQQFATVARDFTPTGLVISVAAGLQTTQIEALWDRPVRVVRVMPNVNSLIGAGMAGICRGTHATADDIARVTEIFAASGAVTEISESLFGAFAAIAGCSPAWTLTYIDALAQGALAAGIPKRQALQIAAAAVAGTGQLAQAALAEDATAQGVEPATPAVLVDRVTSPGGTTIAGLLAAQQAGFQAAVVAAVQAAIKRDQELGS